MEDKDWKEKKKKSNNSCNFYGTRKRQRKKSYVMYKRKDMKGEQTGVIQKKNIKKSLCVYSTNVLTNNNNNKANRINILPFFLSFIFFSIHTCPQFQYLVYYRQSLNSFRNSKATFFSLQIVPLLQFLLLYLSICHTYDTNKVVYVGRQTKS